MKRILALTFLLVMAFGVAQAQAAPYYFGASSFDDAETLKNNLDSLLSEGSTSSFVELSGLNVAGFSNMYITVLAVSEVAYSNGLAMMFNGGASGSVIVDSTDMENTWVAGGALAEQVGEVFFLGSGIMGELSDYNVVSAYLFDGAVAYQPAGDFQAIWLEGGSVFIGLNVTGGNGVEVILAMSTQPFSAVPVPGAVWLMGTGLAGLMALRKRNK